MAEALRTTYQLKITLKDSKPPIWRRFLVASSISLAKFHHVIQTVMGWTDSHLHQFIAGGHYYGQPDPDNQSFAVLDEKKHALNQVLTREKESLVYEYDFGDSWEHEIILEKILPFNRMATLPICVKASGACPPEDIGGIWGYYSFLEALNDPNHPEHDDYKEWIGDDFDPKAYYIREVNELLQEYCR